MRSVIGAVVLGMVCLSGCGGYYTVRVNGYLDTMGGRTPLITGASFYVLENKNASNPIFEREIKDKIERLLRQKGYRMESYESADFFVGFSYAMGPGRTVSTLAPVYQPSETASIRTSSSSGETRTSFITYPGYTSYVPYKYTVYTSSLVLEVMDADLFRNKNQRKQIWIGETANTSENSDIREAVDYLLIAAFEYFGQNTGKSVAEQLSPKDLRVSTLAQ